MRRLPVTFRLKTGDPYRVRVQLLPLFWPCLAGLLSATFPGVGKHGVLAGGILTLFFVLGRKKPPWVFILTLVTALILAQRALYWCGLAAEAAKLAQHGVRASFLVEALAEPKRLHSAFGGQDTLSFPARILCCDLEVKTARVWVKAFSEGQDPRRGDRITLTGKFVPGGTAMNPGEFDERRYLQSKRISCVVQGTVIGVKESPGPRALAARLGEVLQENLPPEDSVLLRRVLLGEESHLSGTDAQDFRRSGFYRFLSFTGFHVQLAARLLETLGRKLTKKRGLSSCLGVLAALALGQLSGWTAGCIRAAVCCSMRTLAFHGKARYDPVAGLSVAGLVVGWFVPFPLKDPGFQLAFAGSLGAWAGRRYPGKFHTLAMLVPFMALTFSHISLAGLVLAGVWTAVLALLIPLCMALFLFPLGWRILGWVPHFLLAFVRLLSRGVSRLSFSTWSVPCPKTAEIFAWCGLLFVRCLILEMRARGKRLSSAFLWMLPAFAVVLLLLASSRVWLFWPEITFLSVGQADCAVARYKGTTVLIDTGTPESFDRHVLPYLERQGLLKVDFALISHLHSDHVGGAPKLLEGVRTGVFLTARGTGESLQQLLGRGRGVVGEVKGGKTYVLGHFTAYVCDTLPPSRTIMEGDLNEASLVVFLYTDKGRLLAEFWGDATSGVVSRALPELLRERARQERAHVVKVPHHGSKDSLVDGFYDRLGGGAAVISVGQNPYGHPSPEAVSMPRENGLSVFRTDECGAVTVTFLERLRIREFVKGRDHQNSRSW